MCVQVQDRKAQLLYASGLAIWVVGTALHNTPAAHAVAGFCLGMGVTLMLGGLLRRAWLARHPDTRG